MTTKNETTTTENTLKIFPRTTTGKSAAYRMRMNKLVPAVVYGPKLKAPINVALDPKDTLKLYRSVGRTGLVTLAIEAGGPQELNGTKILFKEIQSHPFRGGMTHVDLHQLDLSRALRVTVPLVFVGKAKGIAEGGILSIITRQVEIKCLPTQIPNHIDVDVTGLDMNDSLHISELAKLFEGKLEFIYESDIALASVARPEEEKVVVAAVDPAAAAAGTPAAGAAGAPAAAGAAPAAGAKGAAPAAAAKAPAKK